MNTPNNMNTPNTPPNTPPYGVLYVEWDGETDAIQLHSDALLDIDDHLASFIGEKLGSHGWSLDTERENGHSNYAAIYTSDHLDVTGSPTKEELIAACQDTVTVWSSVGFFVEIGS